MTRQLDLGPFGLVLAHRYVEVTVSTATHNYGVSFSAHTHGRPFRSVLRWARGGTRWGARGNGLPKLKAWRVKQMTDEEFDAAFPEARS